MSGPTAVDALFVSYYEDVDRWHNDHLSPNPSRQEYLTAHWSPDDDDLSGVARMYRQAVAVDGQRMDLHRLWSYIKHGSTKHYRRYDPYMLTHLSGSYYRSLLMRHGYSCVHLNTADRANLDQVKHKVAPRFVLLSTSFIVENMIIMDAITSLRRAFPDARIVVGGLMLVELQKSYPPAKFDRLLSAFRADAYIISAMGEEPLLMMLDAAPGTDLATLPLVSTVVRTEEGLVRPGLGRMEGGLPIDDQFVRWNRFETGSLYHTVHLRTARSCAFACSFCSYPQNQGPLTLMGADVLRRELTLMQEQGDIRSIIFTDDTFNVPRRRFKEICRVLADFDFPWFSFMRVQYCDAETADLMAESGCRAVFLGLESINDQVLVHMNKKATRDKYSRGIDELNRVGIDMHANFITGFPGDTEDSAHDIVDFVDRHELFSFNISPWYLSPATPISRRREDFGIEGNFYIWRHDTMDCYTAQAMANELMHQTKHAAFASEEVANGFWTEIGLMSNGFTTDQVRRLFRASVSLAGTDHTAEALLQTRQAQEIRQILDPIEMPHNPDERLL